MFGEVADLDREGRPRIGVTVEVNVCVAVQVQRGEAIQVPLQQRLLCLVEIEHLHRVSILFYVNASPSNN